MTEQVLSGIPVDDVFIFDCHAHLGKGGIQHIIDSGEEGMLRTMAMLGVNAVCVSSTASTSADYMFGNNQVLKAVEKYPDRFYGYVTVNPYYPQYSELKKYFSNPNMLGIKIHAYCQGLEIDDPRFDESYSYANEKALPVLIHTWSQDEVIRGQRVAEKFGSAQIILGHSAFTSYDARLAAINACNSCSNVFVDTTLSSTYDGTLEWLLGQIGSDKILYGSDFSFFDARQTFGRIAMSRISTEDKIKIFGQNAKRIFSLQ